MKKHLLMLVTLAWSSLAFCGVLHDAAKNGDLEQIKVLLKIDPNLVFSKDEDYSSTPGFTPLHCAAQAGHKDVAALLLANKADVNAKNNDGGTPLHIAAANDHEDVAETLLANKADVNAKNNDGVTPLHIAAANGYKDVAELLLAKNADVNAKNNDGVTPLHYAAANGHKDLVQLLLADKADVNANDNSGQTPLQTAMAKGQKDVIALLQANKAEYNIYGAAKIGDLERVKALLESTPNLPFSKDNLGFTPLHYAATNGYVDMVKLLLANKADVNAKNNDGFTPLQSAVSKGQKDVTQILLANKADVSARDNMSNMPLHQAAALGYKDVAELLLANKADVDARGNCGLTPLHFAAKFCHKEVAALLLVNKADVNAKDDDGETPLYCTVFSGQFATVKFDQRRGFYAEANKDQERDKEKVDMLELLLANKADVNAKTNNGQTALSTAVVMGLEDVAELLRQHGGQYNTAMNTASILDAAKNGDLAQVKVLVKQDSGLIRSKDAEYGDTPLHFAALMGHMDVVEFLIATKAEVNAKNKEGCTPLHLAAEMDHKDIVKLLRQYGGHK